MTNMHFAVCLTKQTKQTVMDTGIEIKGSSAISMINRCKNVFYLIKEGRERDAQEKFPMEYYLVNKYLYRSISELSNLLRNRLELH